MQISSFPASKFVAIRLSGGWDVQPIPLDAAITPGATRAHMPDCAHLQPTLYPDNPYWGDHLRDLNKRAWLYRRAFTLPAGDYRRARLRFEGVDYFAEMWVNDACVGRHEGHFLPFDVDITPLARPGSRVALTVRVTSPWDAPNPSGTYPSDHVVRGLVKGLYEHGEGVIPPAVNPIGIWRPVWLLLDQGVSIDQVRIRTELDGRVDLSIRATNATGETWRGWLDLAIEADNHDGAGVCDRLPVTLAPGTQTLDHALRIPDPRWWWCWDHGAPNLYRLDARLLDEAGQSVSEHAECFGVRTVRLERAPERFTYWLNERPVYVRGTSYMPALYLSQVDAPALAHDLALARGANLNLLRLHVHVSPPEVYDLCDRAGMLVWQDFELNWVQDSSPEFEARALQMQRGMIDLLGNHPSVITWACHNEPTMVFARRANMERRPDPALYADACAYDPTRPVFLCS
ncbi:MAG: glycoside hydrolase family 2 TIM barrel-domain containing protein, partial [Anaerolineae bacterium]